MAKSAYLRVYVPVHRSDGPVLEHVGDTTDNGRVLRSGEFGLLTESVRDDAFVIDDGGTRFVCPRHPRLRMLEGVLAFHSMYSDSPLEALVPEDVAKRAARELDHMRSRTPGVRSHILTSPFAVPLRWFAAFTQDERFIAEVDGRLVIRYRTGLADALYRLRHAVRVLEEAGFDDGIVEQVGDVVEWLEEFPRDALVELDYADVVDLFDDTELVLDESAAEVRASLDALEEGDYDAAGEHYSSAASRWAHAHALAYVN
jgi:hypothetical protein